MFNTPSHFDPDIFEYKWSLTCLDIHFVHLSAKFSSQDTYIADTFSCSICSQGKWCAMSICFDRSLILGLYATSIAALLSQKRAVGVSSFNSSWVPRFNQGWCFVVIYGAIYSASQVEFATDRYFRHLRETVAFPTWDIYPEKFLLVSKELQ